MPGYNMIASETLVRYDSNKNNVENLRSSCTEFSNADEELLASRLCLFGEFVKCKTTEEVISYMYTGWQKLGNLAAQSGKTFCPPPDASSVHLDNDSLEQLSQVLVVTHLLAEAMGRAEADAEIELDADAIIQSKDQEISKLRDRLKHYEAANHEMCQGNQELMGMSLVFIFMLLSKC